MGETVDPGPRQRPTFSTYRIHTGYDEPCCGIPSLDAAKAIARELFRTDVLYHEFIDDTEPAARVVFGESSTRGEEEGFLMFGLELDERWRGHQWIGSLAEEVRCACCHRVTAVRTVRYDAERDRG